MPYKMMKKGKKFSVISEVSGRVLGMHDTKEKAMAQMRAAYVSMDKEMGSVMTKGMRKKVKSMMV
jgi:hypothetical protein